MDHSIPLSYKAIFGNATFFDYFLMTFGSLCGILMAITIPYSEILFGQMMDTINSVKSYDRYDAEINRISSSYVVLAAIASTCGFAQATCWICAGERQAQRFREMVSNFPILVQQK